MAESTNSEIATLALRLLEVRSFKADAEPLSWERHWPVLVVTGWASGDGDEGHIALDLHVTVGGHPMAIGGGSVWPRDESSASLEGFDAASSFPALIDETEAMRMEGVLVRLGRQFEEAVKHVTDEFMGVVRNLAVAWIAEEASRA